MPTVLQAGAIVVREEDGMVRVLLVRSKKDPSLWVFPKGHIEAGESARVAALREAFEEAGVAGLLLGRAGPALTFRSGDEIVAVDYYLMKLTAEMPSPEGRDKVWVTEDEAQARLTHENTRALLRGGIAQLQNFRIAELQKSKS